LPNYPGPFILKPANKQEKETIKGEEKRDDTILSCLEHSEFYRKFITAGLMGAKALSAT